MATAKEKKLLVSHLQDAGVGNFRTLKVWMAGC